MAAFPFDALPRSVRTHRARRSRQRRYLLELESLEDRTVPSGSSFHPTLAIMHPAGARPADLPDPWPTAFAPSDIATLYGFDQLPAADDGTGMTIAIVDAYDNPKLVSSTEPSFATSDLHHFDVQYGLPEPAGFFTKVNQDGGTTYPVVDPSGAGNPNGNWEAEAALDVEWAHAIAPGAKIILVEANDDLDATTTVNLFKAVAYAGGRSDVQVVSLSWGDDEFSSQLADDSSYFVQPTGHGVTYVAASGDSGAPSLYPAYSPRVVGIGGTTLNVDFNTGAYYSEDGWSMSGGGPSQFETQPAFQKGVVPASMSTINGTAYRTAPDVAFDADPETGVSVYDSYNGPATGGPWFQIGGTSLGAPAWAGLFAIADQIRAAKGLGSLNGPNQTLPTLYKLSQTTPADFNDPVTGNNGYPAGTGYDLVTGVGTPVANNLVPDLANQAALQVVDSTPAGGASVATPPTQFVITFSDPVSPSSLQPGALKVNNIAASSVALDSTDTIATFTFSTSPVTAQGMQTMAIPAGAVNALGSTSVTNVAFNATFYYDTLPLAITSTSPAPGTTFTLPGSPNFTFNVTFNESIDPTTVKTSSLTLSQGSVSAANVQPGNMTVSYTLMGLTSEGTLTVTINPGIEDQYDNPASPSLTGTFYLDNGTMALPTPLTGIAPSGSLAYQTTAFSSVILYAGDHDQFTVAADPGETLTVLVKPTSSGLTPTVQLSDPSSKVLGSASASLSGQSALLQTVPTTTSGTYTITVGGAGVTTGNYTVQVYLDTALENASQGGAADNTLATAQNLNAAFLALQTPLASVSRAAVLGSVATPVALSASTLGQWDSNGNHDAKSTAYEVGQIPPTQYRNFFVFDLSSINLPITSASLNLTDVTGGYSSPLPSDTYGLFDVTTPVAALVASGSGQTAIFNDLGSGVGYGSSTITTASAGPVISTPLSAAGISALNGGRGGLFAIGGALTSISGSNSQYLFANSGNATDTTQLVVTLQDSRFYSFSLAAGELTTVGLKNLSGTGDSLTIEDASGKPLATATGGSAAFDKIIANFAAPAAGTYYISVSGSSAATYNLVVTRDGTLAAKNNVSPGNAQDLTGTAGVLGSLSSSADWYKVTLGASQTSLQLQTATPLTGPSQAINTLKPNLQLYNASNTLVASGTVLADGRNQMLSASGLTAGATYYIQVSPASGQGEYYLSLPQSAATSSFSKYLVTAANGASSVTAGSSFLVTVQAADQNGNPITSGYSGPANVTVSISPTSTASSFPMTIAIGSNGLGFGIGNINTVGSYTLTAASGSYTGSTGPLSVTVGPAAKLSFATQPGNRPTGDVMAPVAVQIQDQFGNVVTTDNSDQVILGIASGPGPFKTGSTTTVTAVNGVATFNNLTLVVPGTYQFSALVPGSFTGPNSTTFTVAPLRVIPGSFAGSPSGFSLQFNAPFLVNSSTPVLYGLGSGSSKGPAPSVIVTTDPGNLSDTAAMAVGSLILNTTTNTITFLATNTALESNNGSPILADGVYTVIVRASAANNGFQAVNSGGGFLDGLGTGTPGSGDFKATFTVNATALNDDVLWVPATADGPGQALNAPGNNRTGGGYPVYINDSTGTVTHITLTVTYDPALLTVTGVSSNSAISGSTFQLLSGSSPGHLALEYNGTTASAPSLKGGQVPIGFINATVPSGTTTNPTPYKAKNLLHFAGATINANTIPVATSDGLHLVAYVGDANGDGAYSSDDAVKITRVLLQTDTGFAPYPLVDPVIIGDTDGSGFIPSDAALQVNEAGVGVPTSNLSNPPIPAGVHFQAIANNVDPTLSLGGTPTLGDGTVTVAVNIDDPHPAGSTGLIEGHIALTYDPKVFTVSTADVHPGSVLAGKDWNIVPTIDQASGQIAIALSSATPITSTLGGSLVAIDFHFVGRVLDPSYIDLVPSVSPNGQPITTQLEDAQGSFTLTFASTASAIARVGSNTLNAPAMQSPMHSGAASVAASEPVSYSADDNQMVPSPILDASNALVVPEAADAESLGALPAPAETEARPAGAAAAHGLAAVVSSALPSTSVLPLAGLVFEFVNLPLGGAMGNGAAGWQRGSDPLFQALGRTTVSNNDPALAVNGQILERALTGQLFLALPASDSADGFTWDEDGLGLGWQSLSQSVFSTIEERPESTPRQTSAITGPGIDCTTLDQLFAPSADDTELTVEGD